MKSKRKRETNLLKPMQIVGKKKKNPKSNVFLHLLDLMSEHAAFNSNYDTVNLPTMWHHLLFSAGPHASTPFGCQAIIQEFRSVLKFSCEPRRVNPQQVLQLLRDSLPSTRGIWIKPLTDNTLLCNWPHRPLRVNKSSDIYKWRQQAGLSHRTVQRKQCDFGYFKFFATCQHR